MQNAAFSPHLHNLQEFNWIYNEFERRKRKVFFPLLHVKKIFVHSAEQKTLGSAQIRHTAVNSHSIYVTFNTKTIAIVL